MTEKEETYWHHLNAKIKAGCSEALPIFGIIILGTFTILAATFGFGYGLWFIANSFFPSYVAFAGVSGGMLGMGVWVLCVLLIIDYLEFKYREPKEFF